MKTDRRIAASRRASAGLTLIEVMVAIVIALILLAVTVSIFVGNKRTYSEQEEMSRLQENARFALGMLVSDIRMAGYTGCAHEPTTVYNDVNGGGSTLIDNFNISVEGSEAGAAWKPSGDAMAAAYLAGSGDAITVRYLAPTGIVIDPPFMVTPSADLHVEIPAGESLSQGQIVAVSDCASTDIFQISNANPTTAENVVHNPGGVVAPGNDTGNLSKTYDDKASIVRFISRRYFIGTGAGGGPALFRSHVSDVGAEVVEELVEGIENVQILYGEDTNGDKVADEYNNATDVGTWDNVVSVQLALLVRTVEEYGPDVNTATHDLLGSVVDPADDRRRRRVFTSTVQIRNRSF